MKLNLRDIVADKNQPRKYFGIEKMASLKDSIKKHGIKVPLIVYKISDGKYQLVDGERRYRIATELGLKDVPVEVEESKGDFDRLLEQFHIQEQHESWTPTEKAMAILEITEISKKSIKEVCDLLSIDNRTVRSYIAFAELQNKERFSEHHVSLHNAELIKGIKAYTRKIKENDMEESFSKADEGKLEKVIVQKISDKEINSNHDFSRIKDSFKSNPKLIDTFLKGDFNIEEEFVASNAKGARALRNMTVNVNYVISNGIAFLKEKNIKLTETDLSVLKRCIRVCEEIINLAE